MIIRNKVMIVAILLCSVMNVAFALSLSKVPGENTPLLTSDAITVQNWSTLQQDLVGEYNGKVVIANTETLKELSKSKSRSAYVASVGNLEMFSIINQTVSNSIQKKLLSLFNDLKNSDFKKYSTSMTVVATKNGTGNYSVTVMLTGGSNQTDNLLSEECEAIFIKHAFVMKNSELASKSLFSRTNLKVRIMSGELPDFLKDKKVKRFIRNGDFYKVVVSPSIFPNDIRVIIKKALSYWYSGNVDFVTEHSGSDMTIFAYSNEDGSGPTGFASFPLNDHQEQMKIGLQYPIIGINTKYVQEWVEYYKNRSPITLEESYQKTITHEFGHTMGINHHHKTLKNLYHSDPDACNASDKNILDKGYSDGVMAFASRLKPIYIDDILAKVTRNMVDVKGTQKPSDDIVDLSFVLNDSVTLRLPSGTKILTERKKAEDGISVEIYSLLTSLSGASFKAQLISQLSESGISYKERTIAASMTTIVLSGENYQASIIFDQTNGASENNLIRLSIQHFQ